MAHAVFISYAPEDEEVATTACRHLEGKHIRCWIDVRDRKQGDSVARESMAAIKESRLLVLIYSSHTNGAPQVTRDVERAASLGLPIIPFKIEDAPLSREMEYYISGNQWLDATAQPLDRHLDRLVHTVQLLLDPGMPGAQGLLKRPRVIALIAVAALIFALAAVVVVPSLLQPGARAADVVWARTIDVSSMCYLSGMVTAPGGSYLLAYNSLPQGQADIVASLIEIDGAGNVLSRQSYPDNAALTSANAVISLSDGDRVIAGARKDDASLNDALLIKADAGGNVIWSQAYGGGLWEGFDDVRQSTDGGYVATGYTMLNGGSDISSFTVKVDGAGELQWQRSIRLDANTYGRSVVPIEGGGCIVLAGSSEFNLACLLKLSSDGQTLWRQPAGDPGNDYARRCVATKDGGLVVVGYTNVSGTGNNDVLLLKTDASGNLLWRQSCGGAGDDQGCVVAELPDGGYLVAGSTTSQGNGSCDVYVVRTDARGHRLWERTFGGPDYDAGAAVALCSDGGYLVAAYSGPEGVEQKTLYLIRMREA
ncbi:MAG TPA: toll/interleukin-1 receptor domain-containing protein [Methanocella sp.]|jgi:hypothetical protein